MLGRKTEERGIDRRIGKWSESRFCNLPEARQGKRRGGKGDVRRGVTARGAMEKGGCVRVIEGEVRRNDPVEYFFTAGSEMTLESPFREFRER